MSIKNYKKIFLIFILVIFSASLFNSVCFAQGRELEIEYPELGVPGVERPTKTKTALPEYLKYVFTFAIIIAGLLAFGALIYGGMRYLTSAGDPTKMSDAKNQVIAGFSGLIILLSSYLILNTINPQLVLPEKPPLQPAIAGIRIYTMDACQEDDEHPSFRVAQNIKDLTDPDLNWGFNGERIKSIKFLGNPGDLTVNLWPNGAKTTVDYPAGDTEPCKQSGPDFPLATYKSISLDWHLPGVYLCERYDESESDRCGGECKIYQSSSATLPEFDNKAGAIKLVSGDFDNELGKHQLRYSAVLHEHENFMGEGAVLDFDRIGENYCFPIYGGATYDGQANMENRVSSITVYLKPKFKKENGTIIENIIGDGVRFWGDKNWTKEKDKYVLPSTTTYYGDDTQVSKIKDEREGSNDKITSMEMDGRYVALLFRDGDYRGDCEVLMSSDPDFRNNRIGQCGWLGRTDCLSSFIIKARK